ncbi:MAG TPA: GtrA family protein [Caulobacteraceae bacterium]|jgi:putative flippase GtrA
MRRIPPLLALLAATLLLMSVAFADGRPTVFYDSHSYDVMGRDLIETVRDWPASNQNKAKLGFTKLSQGAVPSDRLTDPQTEGARSPFYGVLLHAAYLTTTIWGLAALQSLLAAWVIYLLWRTMAPRAPSWSYLAVVAVAAVGTSISFFTTFAMPDIFAGIGGAAVVLILAQGDRLRKLEIAGLWAVIAYAMVIHKSHWATGLVVAFAGGLMLWILGLSTRSVVRRVLVVASAAVVAWTAGAAFDHVYANRTGYKLGHPPFLMARLVADGPGKAYMLHACGQAGREGGAEPYVLCKFKANAVNSTKVKVSEELVSNLILWSDRKTLGVFNLATRPQRIALESEEMRFVVGATGYDPVGVGLAALSDWGQQLISIQVDDPLRDPSAFLRGRYWPTTVIPKLIPGFQACRPPGSCKPPFDYKLLAGWHETVLVAALLLLAWRLSFRDVRQAVRARGLKDGQEPARVAVTALLLVGVLLANAAVCGILSGPFARYQARLVWLLPVGTGLVACALPMGYARVLPFVLRTWDAVVNLWERIRAQPVIGRFLPPLNGHFMRFCCVGALGFVVDFAVLKTVLFIAAEAGADSTSLWAKVGGRLVSFSFAVVATWLANRTWTFAGHAGRSASLLAEFGGYVTVQSVGFAANLAVYTAILAMTAALGEHLLPAMVAGTAAGMVINYLGAKHFVFRRGAGAS